MIFWPKYTKWKGGKRAEIKKENESFVKLCKFCHSFYKRRMKAIKSFILNGFWQAVHYNSSIFSVVRSA